MCLLKPKSAKLVNESLQLKVADAGSIPAGSTIVHKIVEKKDTYLGREDSSLPIMVFSIWHILILVKLNISPISCSVFGPPFAVMKTQLSPSLESIQFLQSFFLHGTFFCSCTSKHLFFKKLSLSHF